MMNLHFVLFLPLEMFSSWLYKLKEDEKFCEDLFLCSLSQSALNLSKDVFFSFPEKLIVAIQLRNSVEKI